MQGQWCQIHAYEITTQSAQERRFELNGSSSTPTPLGSGRPDQERASWRLSLGGEPLTEARGLLMRETSRRDSVKTERRKGRVGAARARRPRVQGATALGRAGSSVTPARRGLLLLDRASTTVFLGRAFWRVIPGTGSHFCQAVSSARGPPRAFCEPQLGLLRTQRRRARIGSF
jgi:hypothetical protein